MTSLYSSGGGGGRSLRRASPRTSIDTDERTAEKETLLEALLPVPPHPRSTVRALSVGTVAVFLLLVVWMAASSVGSGSRISNHDNIAVTSDGGGVAPPSRTSKLGSWVHAPSTATSPASSTQQDADLQGQSAAAADNNSQEEINEDEDEQQEQEQDTSGLADLAKYTWHRDLEWDADGSGRLIVVGDVHGMVDALESLLKELDYTNVTTATHNDTLVFVGDLVAKHPSVESSLRTVDYIRSLGAWSVRGNHDQDVINFRSYMEQMSPFLPGASVMATTTEDAGAAAAERRQEPEGHLQVDAESVPPEDAPAALKHKWRDEHYQIAKAMSDEAAAWLYGRSLTLHIRSLHAYIVHAGLLPWTIPKRTHRSKGYEADVDPVELDSLLEQLDLQPDVELLEGMDLSQSAFLESFVPVRAATSSRPSGSQRSDHAADPELAILTKVPLNRDPFTLLNMRGIKKNGQVTKDGKKGRPWSPVWNVVMRRCAERWQAEKGSDPATRQDSTEAGLQQRLQCRPLNVIYGHAAARGLDVREYSIGLDSGAVYGRSLSALVIEGKVSAGQYSVNKANKLRARPVTLAGREGTIYSLKTVAPTA